MHVFYNHLLAPNRNSLSAYKAIHHVAHLNVYPNDMQTIKAEKEEAICLRDDCQSLWGRSWICTAQYD